MISDPLLSLTGSNTDAGALLSTSHVPADPDGMQQERCRLYHAEKARGDAANPMHTSPWILCVAPVNRSL